MIQEIMTQVYNMGAVVEECEVIMEFKRSGREGSVLPTDICNMTQVQDVSLQWVFFRAVQVDAYSRVPNNPTGPNNRTGRKIYY